MLTTKQNELHVINSFNDLMKDTKEKQRTSKLVKQYSSDFFMEKLSDSDLEDNKDILDIFQDLSTHYQKYAYIIAMRIKAIIIDDYCTDDYYYDDGDWRESKRPDLDKKGFRIAKKRRVIDTKRVGKDFESNLEEELNNLVAEDYFKNLNKALESYNFNTKIQKMKEKQQRDNIESKEEEIEDIIASEIRSTYSYYQNVKKNDKEDILYNFKHNSEVINSMFTRVILNVKNNLEIDIKKKDIEKNMKVQIKEFVKFKDLEQDEEDSNIPLGWKAYAISKFIDKMIK